MELKKIKKQYGEKAMQFCRLKFPKILETEGDLLSFFNKSIYDRRDFFNDLFKQGKETDFVKFVYQHFDNILEVKDAKVEVTAKELLNSIGYELEHCTTKQQVAKYKKYYKQNEKICTFNNISNRLSSRHIFFLCRKELLDDPSYFDSKREKKKSDEYSTSLLSVQFDKSGGYLAVISRYNHGVSNPDCTLGNNLNNLVPNLHEAFIRDFNLKYSKKNQILNLEGYVLIDNKFYKTLRETNGQNYGMYWYQSSSGAIELNSNHQLIQETILIDLKEKRVKELSTNSFDLTFDKIKMVSQEEYDETEDVEGTCLICID